MRASTQVAPADFAGLGIDVVIDSQFRATDLHDFGATLAADQAQLEGLTGQLRDGVGL